MTGPISTITADGSYRVNITGHTNVQLRVSVVGTGTITVGSSVSAVAGVMSVSSPVALVAGSIIQEGVTLASASFSRPADTNAYAAGDLVANSTTAASVVLPTVSVARTTNQSGAALYAKLDISNTAWLNATVRLHFFGVVPVPTIGDNGAPATTTAVPTPRAGYLGWIDVVLDKQFTDGVAGVASPLVVPEIDFSPISGIANIAVLVQTLTAVTPGSGDTLTITMLAR